MRLTRNGFFSTGYDTLAAVEKEIEKRKAEGGSIWRYFMKAGETRTVLVLTDDPPIIEEHNLKINGKFGNTFTCLKNLKQACPLCDAGDRPSTVGFYLVLDRTGYTSKKGEKVTDQLRVLPAKFKSLKAFKKFSQKYGGLRGCEFEVERSDGEAASIGDSWIKEGKLSEAEITALLTDKQQEPFADLTEFWEKYLAPKTAKALTAVAGGKAAETEDEDNVDFD